MHSNGVDPLGSDSDTFYLPGRFLGKHTLRRLTPESIGLRLAFLNLPCYASLAHRGGRAKASSRIRVVGKGGMAPNETSAATPVEESAKRKWVWALPAVAVMLAGQSRNNDVLLLLMALLGVYVYFSGLNVLT